MRNLGEGREDWFSFLAEDLFLLWLGRRTYLLAGPSLLYRSTPGLSRDWGAIGNTMYFVGGLEGSVSHLSIQFRVGFSLHTILRVYDNRSTSSIVGFQFAWEP